MNVLICPDSYKGSATSWEVANCMESGVKKVFPHARIKKLCVADGGEGTVDAILHNKPGKLVECKVKGPDGKMITARYGLLDNGTAIIEMSEASGITLVKEEERDALKATTYGTGELILSAIDNGCKKIVIGIGGSATTDGGVGMARALGFQFLSSDGEELPPGGGYLYRLHRVVTDNVDIRIYDIDIVVACDVTNPLYGFNGAAYVYSPQKGATPEMVELLDRGLKQLDYIITRQLHKKEADVPGSGAAGGLGFGLQVFCNATLQSGITTVLDTMQFDSYLDNVDLILTGEGQFDGQSLYGKVPIGIGLRAKERGIPVIVIAGGVGDQLEAVYESGVSSIMSTVNSVMTLNEAMRNSNRLISDATERVMRMIKVGRNISKRGL